MENRIENFLDRIFENMVPGVYFFSIFLGLFLIALGFYLFNKDHSSKNSGIISIIIGFIAVIHGAQYLLIFK